MAGANFHTDCLPGHRIIDDLQRQSHEKPCHKTPACLSWWSWVKSWNIWRENMWSFTKNRDQPQNRQVCLTTPSADFASIGIAAFGLFGCCSNLFRHFIRSASSISHAWNSSIFLQILLSKNEKSVSFLWTSPTEGVGVLIIKNTKDLIRLLN